MSEDNNIFKYQTSTGTVSGSFNIYQSRSGYIILSMGDLCTRLNYSQIIELGIDLYSLIDFDNDAYKMAYDGLF